MDNDQPQLPAGPVGMGGGVPDVGNPAPPTINVAPPQAPVVNVQADPAQLAQVQHDSMFGKMAKAILGQQNNFSVDPQTGALQNNPVPERPGQLFRSILGAALLGGAAGAQGDPAQGFAGGLARGGAAGVQQQHQQDQEAQKVAQQGFQNNQKVQEQDRQNTLMHATLAEQHSLQVARQHTSDLQDQEYHDRHNAASGALLSTLDAAGGQPAAVVTPDGVKSDFTAPDLAAAYTKDPSILKAPQGFVRHFIDTTDSSNLTFNGTQWVDDSGKPVNMTDKTTVKAIDTPIDSMNKKLPTSNDTLNTLIGAKVFTPGGTSMASPKEQMDLNNTRMKNDKEKQETDLKKRQVDISAGELGVKRGELALKEKLAEGGGASAEGYSPEEIADAIHTGRGTLEQLTQGMGKDAAQFRKQVTGAFLKKYPETLEEYKNYAKIAETPQVQSQLTNARSIFGMDGQPGSFDTLETAIRAVPKASFPMLSELRQKTAYNLGSPEMAEVKALKTDLSTELAKFNTGGGNATSDTQIEHYRQQLNEAQTPEQVDKVLKDIRAISSKRLDAVVGKNPFMHNLSKDINDPVTRKPRGVNAASNLPEGNGQKIDPDTAQKFLQQAGGDPNKARQLAQQHKWVF